MEKNAANRMDWQSNEEVLNTIKYNRTLLYIIIKSKKKSGQDILLKEKQY